MKKGLVRAIVVLMISVFFISGISFGETVSVEKNIEYLKGLMNLIESKYVGDITEEQLMEGAFKGMFEVLDTHSTYLSPDEYENFNESVDGEFSGIGVTITKDGNYIGVISPIEDTPAYMAGVKSGDIIISVNDIDINGWSMEKVVSNIRGERGTTVKIGIKRPGKLDTLFFTIKRDIIVVKYVDYEIIDNNIGYIDIESFVKNSSESVKEAVKYFEDNKVKGIILDLRGNPGGELPEAVKISDLFVSKGKSIVFIDSKAESDYEYFAENDRTKIPLVVLVDEGSASASEIVAGAIKDNKEGILIGKKTYGKGTVQSVWTLKNNAGVKITIAEYFSPKRNKINGIGVTPDFIILNPDSMDENQNVDFAPMIEGGSFQIGDRGINIYGAQQRLKYIGYSIKADGIYGEETKKVLLSFQRDNNLEENGILDLVVKQKILEATRDRFVIGSSDLQLEKAKAQFE